MKATASVALAAAFIVAACGATAPTTPPTSTVPTASAGATAIASPTTSLAPTSNPSPTSSVLASATVAPTAAATVEPTAAATETASLPPPTDAPGLCAEADLIFDPVIKELLLVNCTTYAGGPTHLTVWGWNGSAWHVVTSGPAPARVVGGAALDTARGVLTVYGGYVPEVDPCDVETWEWDHTDWTHIDADPPTACDHMKMIYVPGVAESLLMGGQDPHGAAVDETWAWVASTWQQTDANLPPSRAHFGLQYDPAHEQVLLYGGLTTTAVLDDFWSWQTGQWHQIATEACPDGCPGARSHLGMAYDTNKNELLLFGGATSDDSFGSLTNDMWLYADFDWRQLHPDTSPSPRGSAALGYDPERNEVVLYGGFDANGFELNDTWLWNGHTWECAAGCA